MLPFLSPKHTISFTKTSSSLEQRQKKGDWERIVGVSDHHPPASQSLINIRPPKPLPIIYIYIYIYFSKSATLYFLPKYLMPSTLFSDSFMQRSPSPKSKPKNPKLKCRKLRCRRCHQGSYEQSKNSNAASEASFGIFLRFFFLKKIYLTVHGW